MLRNYLKTAFRSIARDKRQFVLHLGGLAVGIAGALLLLLTVHHELSYDRHQPDADRIFRLACSTRIGNVVTGFAALPPAVGPALREALPEIEQMARFQGNGTLPIKKGNERFTQEGIYFADSSLLRVFTFRFIWGNNEALTQPDRILLTKKLADKLFDAKLYSTKSPLGQRVNVAGRDFLVSGVVENPPANSHFQFSALIAWHSFDFPDGWDDAHAYTYVRLARNADVGVFSGKVARFVAERAELKELAEKLDAHIRVVVQPLTDIHLHSNFLGELSPPGSRTYGYLFILLAAFFLLCSGINYTNLAIAGSVNRSKEIGVRKALGAERRQIQRQFLSESVLLTFFASLVGLGLAWLSLPYFSQLVDKDLTLNLLELPMLGWFTGLVLLIGLLAGAYPAFYLSGLDPTRVLKSRTNGRGGHLFVRKALVTGQVTMAVVMISATLLMKAQMEYMSDKELGFVKENLLIVPIPGGMGKSVEFFKAEVLKNPQVLGVAASNYLPGNAPKDEHRIERQAGEMKVSTVHRLHIDAGYLPLLGIKTIRGRGFNASFPSDYTGAFLVNEAAARTFGWDAPGENPIGKKIDGFNYGKQGVVIGVVKDGHLFSMRRPIEPIVINLSPGDYRWGESLYIKLKEKWTKETVADIRSTYNRVFNAYPFEYYFFDDQYGRLYQADQRMSATLRSGATVMVVLSCLGVFGLSAFVAAQRTKETAIRKVLGASVKELVRLHVKGFIGYVILANLIAWPVSYGLMQAWLRDFAYRIDIPLSRFLLAGFFIFLVVLITVSYHAIRTARANPVRFLKQE